MKKVLAHIVLHNSPETALLAVASLLEQKLGDDLSLVVLVSDNASTNDTVRKLKERFPDQLQIHAHQENLGFAAAQNYAAAICIAQGFDYLFLVNPDARFEPDVLLRLCTAVSQHDDVAGATPLLYRADPFLQRIEPPIVDAAGMIMTTSLRHLDREEYYSSRTETPERVFGGTGAALLLKREAISRLALDCPEMNQALYRVYPQLRAGAGSRMPLFDEAFFAYREDADLAWRGQILGLGMLFVPQAVGYHVRHVLPERRAQLSPLINRWSVRNRFLMQLNNFSFQGQTHCILPGLIVRNLIVICGVLLREWSSVGALSEVVKLLPRALARRRALFARSDAHPERIGNWFGKESV